MNINKFFRRMIYHSIRNNTERRFLFYSMWCVLIYFCNSRVQLITLLIALMIESNFLEKRLILLSPKLIDVVGEIPKRLVINWCSLLWLRKSFVLLDVLKSSDFQNMMSHRLTWFWRNPFWNEKIY